MSTLKYSINPDRSKPWNDLPLLPIDKTLHHSVDILEQLGKTKEALGRLMGRAIVIPNQGILINTISLQEAKDSSAIENIFTTHDELYRAFSINSDEEHHNLNAKEVLHYREALWTGYHYIKKHTVFDSEYFKILYSIVKQSGEGFRKPISKIIIRQAGTGPNTGKTVYTPPRGKGVIEEKIDNLIEFINNDEDGIDPLIKMTIAHFQFEAIHPFSDGNGRIGRIFNIHYLTSKGMLDLPILYLSRFILEHKSNYYSRLAGVSQRGEWKEWIIYILKAIQITSIITFNKINDIIDAQETIMETITRDTKIRKPKEIIEAIFIQPFTRVKHLTSSKIYSENTARKYLNQMTTLGILERKTISGHHYYLNKELYRILAE